MFYVRLHGWKQVYGIHLLTLKWITSAHSLRSVAATIEANEGERVTHPRKTFWRRNRWLLWVGTGVVTVLAALAVTLGVLARRVEPYLHARIIATLEARFHARVELDSFHLGLRVGQHGEWGVWAQGRGLRIWPPEQVANASLAVAPPPGAPLIRLDEFNFHAPLRYRRGMPIHIPQVRLTGLDVRLPRRSDLQHPAPSLATPGIAAQAGGAEPALGAPLMAFHIDQVVCTAAHLQVATSKLPLDFAISYIQVTGFDQSGVVHFTADLTNPRPRGQIHATGSLGPWQVADPGETPVAGAYRFDHADLATFKGVAGILASTGRYQGTLRQIAVEGETDTADFRLTPFGTVLPLHTWFKARVDGTTGDTWLDAVDATLGSSHFTAKGQIVRVLVGDDQGLPRGKGHEIALAVNVDRGRIEDFLRLTSHSGTPLLTGDLQLETQLHIAPGPMPVHQRIELQGQFALDKVAFTSESVQHRIQELSLRGQGRPGELKSTSQVEVQSQMEGRFNLAGGVLTLPDLAYTVPGAVIALKGTYTLDGGELNFVGVARTQATVSQMVGGWKGMLLKPADRFFRKDGAGASIPIHISGTRQSPDFGVDLNRLKTTSPERPDAPGPQPTPSR